MVESNQNPKPICVVLDTNIWVYRTSLLRTPLGAAFINALIRLEGRLGLPEVVEEEIIKHTVRAGQKAAAQMIENARKIERLIGWAEPSWSAGPTVTQFESSARARLLELDALIERVPFNLEQARSALQRVMDETPPNGSGNQQYKDSVIWEAALDLSKEYSVHFVTQDKAFFENRDPRKGLASDLNKDCAPEDRSISVHYGMESYLESTRETVPPLDYGRLASEIDRAIRKDLARVASEQDFELGELGDSAVSVFLTENANVLALSFELVHRASVVLPSGDIAARLVTKGECSYNLSQDSVFDIRKSSVELLDQEGNLIDEKIVGHFYVYAPFIGEESRRRPYTLHQRLDE